jgi:hypothetical protein
MKNVIIFIIFVVSVTGCASQIETVRVDPITLQATGKGIEGVIYYEPRLVKVHYEFTQLIDEKNGKIGHDCEQVGQKDEIVTLPDYQNPKAILHKPSWFSSSEFGVTLNNGMLTGVTSNSTPQTAPILEQIVKAKEASLLTMPVTVACNAGPVITKIEAVKF